MEIDKTQLTAEVASAIWSNQDPFGERGALEDQDKMVQFNLKMSVLPVLIHALPTVEKHIKQIVLDKIASGQDNGLSAEEIVWSLQMELTD